MTILGLSGDDYCMLALSHGTVQPQITCGNHMIKLEFVRPHLSITDFPPADLPDFTLITGPNGAGKSHLLQAIQNGLIKCDIAPDPPRHIRHFDWTNMIPQDGGIFDSHNIKQERHRLYQQYSQQRAHNGAIEPARALIRSFGLNHFEADPGKLLTINMDELSSLVGNIDKAMDLRAQLELTLHLFDEAMHGSLEPNFPGQLRVIADYAKVPLVSLTEREIMSPHIPIWGYSDLFQQNLGKLFATYRDIYLANNLAQLRASKGDKISFLSDEEFVERHGRPPWDFFNRAIESAGLDFVAVAPPLDDYAPFQPKLKKRTTEVEVPFNSLSSGEKILLSLAFCVYQSSDGRQTTTPPKVLLLDEIDAPLHPSMSRNLINTITRTLVNDFKIAVIATTHSPSTVALANEESIFTMRPDVPGLHKNSKANALNILTVGVPTIAISYDGRRQVFVESPTDAKIYDALYKLTKSKVPSERSLEFIATGTRKSGGGDMNTGCENVIRVVASLADAGNSSVFGLLDWDGKNNPDDRISVLAHGKRNGIENVLFDPLILALAIARSHPSELNRIGVSGGIGYVELAGSDQAAFQSMVDSVGHQVFGTLPASQIDAGYMGGLSLSIDSRFGSTDDHELENKVITAFPFLRSISKGGQSGKLLEHMVTVVLTDTKFIPADIVDVFTELLERPSHR
ncbi:MULTISPECIES: AAA family ATPase [Rhizobium]|uniref:Energy-coupling factor transporter ATP-binding protein EcfA2 n=1 Tax=Rhizobium esperanzae TaxID=1967781 RepID=A0A7W6UFU2_9HYPH|nr:MULTISPECIES: AAA family ATPase [Rhizobium]MBB4437380.1 energy-coupling factor transporter ATP-binding protein EcfA2 [Rhizobium esperanzae]MDH6199956.1 energy-coupling factor transporter ATP-binding protein EcfA2 [Rhizobium leguminosarum]